jgi:hypothetical protein
MSFSPRTSLLSMSLPFSKDAVSALISEDTLAELAEPAAVGSRIAFLLSRILMNVGRLLEKNERVTCR